MNEEERKEMIKLEESVKELIEKNYDIGYQAGYEKGKEDGLSENPKLIACITILAGLVFFILMLCCRNVIV